MVSQDINFVIVTAFHEGSYNLNLFFQNRVANITSYRLVTASIAQKSVCMPSYLSTLCLKESKIRVCITRSPPWVGSGHKTMIGVVLCQWWL